MAVFKDIPFDHYVACNTSENQSDTGNENYHTILVESILTGTLFPSKTLDVFDEEISE